MPVHFEITAVAVVALAALVCGVVLTRLRQPAIVGYIVAGVILGPSGLELISNREAVGTLAEFGVLMLLLVVGMELNLRRFVTVWRVSLLTTLIQIAGSVGVALLLRHALGWSIGLAVLIGFVVSVSSTAVVIKTLSAARELSTAAGRVSLGVLIAQDMAVVPMTLVLNALAQSGGVEPAELGKVAFSLVFLGLLMWFLVRRRLSLPFASWVADDEDLSPLGALAFCFGAAALSGLLDLSPAYGAFLAGLVLGNSAQRGVLLERVQPIQSVLMMVFFLSIGLLLDLSFLWKNLGTVLLLLAMVTVFKTALNVGALKLLGESWPSAFLVGVTLAQIGEFSFLLAETGAANKLIQDTDSHLVVSVTVLSLMLSPLWLVAARRLHRAAEAGRAGPRDLMDALAGREVRAMLAGLRGAGRGLRRLVPRRRRRPPVEGEQSNARSQP